MKTLHPAGIIPLVTRLDRGAFGAKAGTRQEMLDASRGPVQSAPIQFILVANAPAYVLAVANPRRVGLILQNRDPAATLFYNFGANANSDTGAIAPGGSILLDFICPTDQVSVFATANVAGYYVDFSKVMV